jgi:hypothetical protein
MSVKRVQTNDEGRAPVRSVHTSEAGLNGCGHAAEKPAGQAVVIPQNEGERPYETAQGHGRDITIPD